MQYQGKVFKYGRDVDTDVIIPARYLNSSDPAFLAQHCMEDIDAAFASTVEQGDIMVADENFGCGSSREHAPIAINTGLAIVECPEAVDAISAGDQVAVDTDAGVITDITTGQSFSCEPYPAFLQEIISAGGLIQRTREGGE